MYIQTIKPYKIFKHACLHPRPHVWLRALKIYGRTNQQLKANIEFVEKHTSFWKSSDFLLKLGLSNSSFLQKKIEKEKSFNTCSHCKQKIKEEDFDYYAAYWSGSYNDGVYWRTVHKQCKKDAHQNESYECQNIDTSCNDCKHFVRGKSICKGSWEGYCQKLNKPTKAHALVACPENAECFEHRKS